MTQVVFLIDVSALHNSSQRSSKDERNIYDLRLAILRILCYLSNHYARRPECLRWSYKFFSSQSSPLQVMDRPKAALRDFNLESFEEFEADVVKKYSRFVETLERLDKSQCERGSSAITDVARFSREVLKEAVIQLFCDYAWDVPDMSSPDKNCRKTTQQSNFVFIVSKVSQFADPGDQCNIESILPPILLSSLTEQARLYWIDVDFQKEKTNAMKLDTSSPMRLLPFAAACNSHHCIGLPLSSVLNHFLFPCSNSSPTSTTLVRSGKEVCTLCLYPALRNRSSGRRSNVKSPDGKNKQQIATVDNAETDTKVTRLEITGCIESTPTAFSSLEGDSFICAFGGEPFNALLKLLHSHSAALVLSCTGSNPEHPQLGIFFPINMSLGSLAMLVPGPLLRQSHDPKPKDVLSSFNVFDRCTMAACEESAKNDATRKSLLSSPGSTQHARNTFPLDMSILEKWAVPRTIPFVDSLQNECRAKVTSSSGVMNLMKGVQKAYRPKYPNLVATRTQKAASAQEFQMLKKSPKLRRCRSATLNVSQRSSRLVEKSLRPQNGRIRSTPQTLGLKKTFKAPSHILNITKGYSDEATLFKYLSELYDAAVNGNSCLLTCAQTLVSVVTHHATINQTTARKLAEKHFLLPVTKINEKYENDHLGKDKRLREYQLQTLLHLELESSSGSNSPEAAETVTIFLRTMSFVAGAQELNKFLHDVVKENYEETLKSFLEDVSDELSIPLFPSDSADDSDNYEDDPIFSVSSSCASVCSTVSLQETTQNKRNILAKHPSFTSDNQMRQIHVPKRLLPRRKTKQARVSSRKSSSKKFPHKVKLTEMGQVCRNLFKQEQLRTPPRASPKRTPAKLPFVPETPSEKQGRKCLISSPGAQCQDLPTIVEESPCKVVLQRIDEGSHRLGYASLVATPSKIDPLSSRKSCATPKTPRSRPKDSSQSVSPRTPRTSELMKSPAASTRSSRRLFTSPKSRTPVRNRLSNMNVSPSTRCSPRLAKKNVTRPTRLSFSPRKFSLNDENTTPRSLPDRVLKVRRTEVFHATNRSEQHVNSDEEIMLITPPPKRIHRDKGHKNGNSVEKPYVTPSALSLLHLTTSPVLDIIPRGKRRTL